MRWPRRRNVRLPGIPRRRSRVLRIESLETRRVLSTGPLITEFLASNDTTLDDGNGNSSDWIEVFNPTAQTIDLSGWHLTDDAGVLDKWTFPAPRNVPQDILDLDPGEYMIVFASGQHLEGYVDVGGNLHANFQLAPGGEYLALVQPDGVTIEHEYAPAYPPQTTDISYGLAFDVAHASLIAEGATAQYLVPSGTISNWNALGFDDLLWSSGSTGIGYETSPADYTGFIETTVPAGTRSVYMRQNFQVAEPDAVDTLTLRVRYDDGFLAYLNGTLVASANAPASPQFDSTATAGHADSEAVLFANFDISHHLGQLVVGDNVLAVQALNRGSSSDMLIETGLESVEGSLREPLEPGLFGIPSPGSANGDSHQGFVADTTVSIDRGFFVAPITVEITTPTVGATVVYTTDGSMPSFANGVQVVAPDANTVPAASVVVSATTVLRVTALKDDFAPADVGTHTYVFVEDVITSNVMDPAITENPAYAPRMEQALLDLPSVSLVFADPIAGSRDEQRTSVEWLSPDGAAGFQVDAGIAQYGGYYTNFAKKNFRLYFRSDYGTSRLKYPLFEGYDRGQPAVESFDQLNFRSGSHDMSQRGFYMSNRFTDDTMLDIGHLAPHGRFVHLYINGVYWGQFHMRERWNADMLAQYSGGDEDEYEAINGNLNVGGWSPGDAYDGDGSGWEAIKAMAGDYESIREYLDVANYLDYMLLYMSGNSENEYRTGGTIDGSVPFVFFLNDADGWLRSVSDRTGNVGPGDILSGLIAEGHPDFEILLADRIQELFFNDGALTEEKNVARLQERLDEVEFSFLAESARWGYRTPASWESAAENAIQNLLPALTQTMMGRLRGRGLFPSVNAPAFSQQGGPVSSGFQLTLSAETLPPSDNLAFGKPTIQSSEYPGFASGLAVNGELTDFSHTGTGDLSPFLEVNLEGETFIERIVLHNRDNCCQQRLYNISVEIRDVNDQVVFTSPVFNPVSAGGTPTSPGDFLTLDLTDQPGGGIDGQFIRVNKTAVGGGGGNEYLSLGELEVFGDRVVTPPASGMHYTLDGSDPRLPGGALNPNAILYEDTPITIATGTTVQTRTLQGTTWSALNAAVFTVSPLADAANLRITEVHFNPQDALPQFGELDLDNDEFEFVELQNIGNQAIDLNGVRFVEVADGGGLEGIDFSFSQSTLVPGERVLVVRNQAAFESRYGLGRNVVGEFGGKLANGGELLTLWASDDSVIQQFAYDDNGAWPDRTDGQGSSLVVVHTDGDYGAASNWQASMAFGGTPGAPVIETVDVLVNEVLAHSDLPELDAIELYNTSTSAVDLSGWWLSDSGSDLLKYQIAANTTLDPGGYLVLDEQDFNPSGGVNPNDFALSAAGDDVWLLESDAQGKPLRFTDVVSFDATRNAVTLGRVPNGSDAYSLFPLANNSLGSPNRPHLAGPVVVSEFHYHPTAPPPGSTITEQQLEFLEIYNRSDTAVALNNVPLSDGLLGGWRLRGGVDFDFSTLPIEMSLAPADVLVVVAFDPANETLANQFRSIHGVDTNVVLIGPFSGQMDNGGEAVRLLAPTDPPLGDLEPAYYLVDRVTYDDATPWPTEPDGGGQSLARLAAGSFGDAAASWQATIPSPGSVVFPTPGDFDIDGDVDGQDLAEWEAGFGTLVGGSIGTGDADTDGDVDGNDFLSWQRNYGSTAATTGSGSIASATVSDEGARDNVWAAYGLSSAAQRDDPAIAGPWRRPISEWSRPPVPTSLREFTRLTQGRLGPQRQSTRRDASGDSPGFPEWHFQSLSDARADRD